MKDTLLTAARKKIKTGDLVMVAYPLNENTNNPAHKLDGQQFVVKSVRRLDTRGGDRTEYTLFGAVSDAGVPYVFLSDELIKL